MLKNPFYASAYAYGKGEKRTEIVDGRARKSYGHRKPLEEWEVLLKDHHEAISTGQSSNGTRSSSQSTPIARRAVSSRGAADVRCWPGCYPVAAAGGT